MSEVNHRRNGHTYLRREKIGCTEVLWKDGTWIPYCDIPHQRRIDRRKIRHNKRFLEDTEV